MAIEGQLIRNENQRFEIESIELKSGTSVEILINRTWLLGVIAHWREAYYWFSRDEGIPVILRNGLCARLS